MNDSSSSISGDVDVDEKDGRGGGDADGVGDEYMAPIAEWETTVIVAVNVARVDVLTNMGNIMGQAT